MCGIFGRVGPGLSLAQAEAAALAAAGRLRHRGPDGQATVAAEGLLLGATRLAIMDPAGGSQPFATPSGQTVAVFNGEIYNLPELAAHLAARGRQLRTRCDGEVLPHLYELHGDGFLSMLDGMFALAIWDWRQRRLLVAVDRMGIKPLYMMEAAPGGAWAFASELRALLPLTGRPLTPEPAAVAEYLCLKAVYPPRTLYRGVTKLPGGAWWAWEEGRVKSGSYAAVACDGGSVGDAVADAVASCLAADRPLACLVSGGLDSALVAALAASQRPGLPLFCVGYPGEPPEDERRYARLLAQRIGSPLTEVEVGWQQVPALLERVVGHLEEPIQDPVTLPTMAVMAAVGRSHRVVLTGDGADELFGGYARFRALMFGDRSGYEAGLYAFHPHELGAEGDAWLPPRGAGLEAMMAWEQAGRLPAYHLVRVDKLSMACSVEARVPFLRNGVLAAAAGLAPAERISVESEKLALRAAAAGVVPPEILARRKQPFTFPVYGWLQGPLRMWATDLLLDPQSCVHGLVDAALVRRTVERLAAGDPGAASRIWALLQLDGLGRYFLNDRRRDG